MFEYACQTYCCHYAHAVMESKHFRKTINTRQQFQVLSLFRSNCSENNQTNFALYLLSTRAGIQVSLSTPGSAMVRRAAHHRLERQQSTLAITPTSPPPTRLTTAFALTATVNMSPATTMP